MIISHRITGSRQAIRGKAFAAGRNGRKAQVRAHLQRFLAQPGHQRSRVNAVSEAAESPIYLAFTSLTSIRRLHVPSTPQVVRTTRAVAVKADAAASTQDKTDVSTNTDNVLAIILGGGAGTRLYPLTKTRAKPAVPLGANYRLIDIPVSNCINSDINKVYCLTQFNSASLNRHLSQAYNSNVGTFNRQGFVEVLAAQQSPINKDWFQGTADAVRPVPLALQRVQLR